MIERRSDLQTHPIDEQGSVVSGPTRRQLSPVKKVAAAGLITTIILTLIWTAQLNRAPAPATQPEAVPSPSRGTSLRAAPAAPAPFIVPAVMPMPAPSVATYRPSTPERSEPSAAESGIFAFSGGGEQASTQQGSGTAAPSARSTSAVMLSATRAAMLPHPDLLMTMGTIIPCTLQTAIDTQLPGYVKRILPQDVRSTTGNVILLDRGTIVVGKLQGGLSFGQDRAFVIWERAETPDHAVIELASPAADELGRSGLPGTVNTHFWDRFGAAILLSVVQGSLQAGTAYASSAGGGTSNYFSGAQSNGQQVSNPALQATMNIPPSLEKNQGDNISIFVVKDLDFSEIYRLRVTRSAYAK